MSELCLALLDMDDSSKARLLKCIHKMTDDEKEQKLRMSI